MANSRYDYHKPEEERTDLFFNRDTYIIIRIDGYHFHKFCSEHNFNKPNDKRGLDLMIESAKQVMRTFKGHIPLAYGHSDEFSFLFRCTSDLFTRRVYKITSILPVVFATYYNTNWNRFFGKSTKPNYDAWFDARPKEYPNYRTVIEYFRWRQVDCHINNLYNTTLHTLTGRYVRHKLIEVDNSRAEEMDTKLFDNGSGDNKLYELKITPISDWINDCKDNDKTFFTSTVATKKLDGTVKKDKHEIMFKRGINYNNELEQFKKGTVIVDTQRDYKSKDKDMDAIRHYHRELVSVADFWDENSHIFEDYVVCPPTNQGMEDRMNNSSEKINLEREHQD